MIRSFSVSVYKKNMKYNKVCIIGAGASGLVSAKYLSSAGFNVTIYDRTDTAGGTWAIN